VSKFHPIWCHIAQESSLGRKGWILVKNHVFRDLLSDNVGFYDTMSKTPGQCPTDSFSSMFINYFGRILLIECPFDPILLLLAS
jgi:hypothetical protein